MTTVGCGMLLPQAGSQNQQTSSSQASYVVPKETQDAIRQQDQRSYAAANQAADEELDRLEKQALKALRLALGKESLMPGGSPSASSSTALKGLQGSNIKLRIEPVVDMDGKAVNDDNVQLKNSYSDRVMQLHRKLVDGSATKAEKKEIEDGSKYSLNLSDLGVHVSNLSLATMMANQHVQTASLITMEHVSNIVSSRKRHAMELNGDDYALIRSVIDRQKRAEAIAGATLAMMGAYQAVINDKGDAKALDVIAEAGVATFPIKVTTTEAEAKQYVAQLGGNAQKLKVRWEANMRKVWGDAKYERMFKSGIDATFASIEKAQDTKSINQTINETDSKYREDVVKCKRGEDPGPGSLARGSCKALHRAAQTGNTSELLPGARKAFEDTGGANGVKLGTKESAALDGAQAAAKGDVDGMLDSAGKLFPAESTVGASLQGIAAIKKGDAKGAINAALSLVPVPGLKDAFGLASKLLFK